jgi:hypothetical protein
MSARKREKAWTDFAKWCRDRGLRPLPAHAWTLAAYARWCEARHRYPAIVERVQAIARVHLLACATAPDRHPTVTRTLRSLELRSRARPGRAALFPADEAVQTSGTSAARPVAERSSRKHWRETPLRTAPRLVTRRPKRG